MPDRERDDVAKIRSLKAEILLNRKPENVKLENKEEKLDSVSTVRDRDVPPSPPSNNGNFLIENLNTTLSFQQ